MSNVKRCPHCREEKPWDCFARRGDGLQPYCRKCSSEKAKEWAAKNMDRKREHARKSAASNPDRVRENKRKFYERHAERLRNESRSQPTVQREKRAARQRQYRMKNPEKIRQLNRARVATMRATGSVKRSDIDRLILLQRGRCASCRKLVVREGKGFHLDHKQPVTKGGDNSFHNLQILCPRCNRSKSARDPLEFMRSMGFLL